MTKSKNTKRALFASVLSMMLCCAMLVGSTFAWFTDSVKTAVNKIQSGKLDVSLEMKDADGNWVSAEGETLGWLAADGRAQDQILWEPGATYRLPDVRIINNGNLALKYKVIVNSVDGDAKLLEAIEFTYGALDVTAEGYLLPDETSDAITITGHMDELAGNEYQDLSIEGLGITVIATQYTYEQDSTDDQYDKNAEYPKIEVTENSKTWYDDHATESSFTIKNGNELAYLAELVNAGTDNFAGKTVTLANDIVLPNGEWVAIGTYDKPFMGTFDGVGHTVSNVMIHDNDGTKVGGFFGAISNATIQNLTVSGEMTLGGLQGDSNDAFISGNGGICAYAKSSTISGCTNAVNINAADRKTDDNNSLVVGGIVGFGRETTVSNCKNKGNITVPDNAIAGGITSIIGTWSGPMTVTITNSDDNTGVVSGTENSLVGSQYGVNTDE
ncbi:MAG: hypothetical protein HFE30_03845 [Clostridiales bacterium]|nr:hypothetical protein [Clostridiales bacterium]